MKWMCLTARHHDGYCLFDSPHPNAFTSVQTLHRDLLAEYVTACRAADLKVGVYYSPLSWRYPGYYDVTGTKCLPNKFGYATDPSHAENARLMKEENYANVKKLMTGYGKNDHLFWDGGWLGQHGSDASASYFHEPGQYLDPANRWPIAKQYLDLGARHGQTAGDHGHGPQVPAGRDRQPAVRLGRRHPRTGGAGRDGRADPRRRHLRQVHHHAALAPGATTPTPSPRGTSCPATSWSATWPTASSAT